LRPLLLLLLANMLNALDSDNIFHNTHDIFYVNPQGGEIKLRVAKNSIESVFLISRNSRIQMNIGYRDEKYDYYSANLIAFDSTFSYSFLVKNNLDSLLVPAESTFRPMVPELNTPDWTAGKIYYLINPDGFYNGDILNDPVEKNDWDKEPKDWLPYGGDLKGIIRKMDYLSSLDPDIILLTPIFTATSNHKLNTRDYATIDPVYGDTNDLKLLIETIHARDKKIMLSVVFTHTGEDFPAFNDIATKSHASRYANWYQIKSMPIDSAGFEYDAWRSDPRLPMLNLANRQLQDYLVGFTDYWAHFGFDGFYIGEHEEINADFMKTLYSQLKSKYPELIIISNDCRMQTTQCFDCCFSRKFNETMIEYFVTNKISTAAFDSMIHRMLFFRPAQMNCANLFGFYDYTKRIGSTAATDLLKIMYTFIFTFCGSPVLLYGDEIGMTECAPLNWGSFNWNTEQQNGELWRTVRSLIRIRKENPQIQDRYFFTLYIDDIKRVYAYDRGGFIVVLNCGTSQSFVELPTWDGSYVDLASGAKYTAFSQKLKLSVDPLSYRILKREV